MSIQENKTCDGESLLDTLTRTIRTNQLKVAKHTRVRKYNEILILKKMLEEAKIPFVFEEVLSLGGYHIIYSDEVGQVCSVIEHYGSYGHKDDLLEIMGLLTEEEKEYDEVVGYLSAENVFNRIKKHYEENQFKVVE